MFNVEETLESGSSSSCNNGIFATTQYVLENPQIHERACLEQPEIMGFLHQLCVKTGFGGMVIGGFAAYCNLQQPRYNFVKVVSVDVWLVECFIRLGCFKEPLQFDNGVTLGGRGVLYLFRHKTLKLEIALINVACVEVKNDCKFTSEIDFYVVFVQTMCLTVRKQAFILFTKYYLSFCFDHNGYYRYAVKDSPAHYHYWMVKYDQYSQTPECDYFQKVDDKRFRMEPICSYLY